MEQYVLDPRLRSRDIPKIFRRFRAAHIFIRRVGSQSGNKMVDENLRGRTLEVKRGVNELAIFIDGVKRFTFVQSKPQDRFQWGRSFAIAYEREPLVSASTGLDDPYDPNLPSIMRSVLRCVNYGYLLEITFEGIIRVEKTRPWLSPIFYWRVKNS